MCDQNNLKDQSVTNLMYDQNNLNDQSITNIKLKRR